MATLPDMWERTITIGSAGKTFGVTGWRIGWTIGPAELIKPVVGTHSRTVFCTVTPLQDAVARCLTLAPTNDYFEQTRFAYQRKRDILVSIFTELGLPVTIPQGSFFMLANMSRLVPEYGGMAQLQTRPSEEVPSTMETLDYSIARWLTSEIGVTGIPTSAFYAPERAHLAKHWIRFCFAKSEDTLAQVKERLQGLRPYLAHTHAHTHLRGPNNGGASCWIQRNGTE